MTAPNPTPARRAALMSKLAETRAAKKPKMVESGKPTKKVLTPAKLGDEARNHPKFIANPGQAQSEAKAEEQTKQVLRAVIVKGGQKDPGDGVSVEALMALAHALKLSVPEQAGEPMDAGRQEPMMVEAGGK